MKAIMISIKPKWVAEILNGNKTIEIRKTCPKQLRGDTPIKPEPIDVYIYCTKEKQNMLHKNCADIYWIENTSFNAKNKKLGIETQPCLNGKVVAKFTLNKVEEIKTCESHNPELLVQSCLNAEEFYDYLTKNKNFLGRVLGYAIHISDLEIFDKPKKISEFEKAGSYNNPTIKCPKKEQGRCNYGKSPFTGKWVGCEKARLTKAPQNMCYIEIEDSTHI